MTNPTDKDAEIRRLRAQKQLLEKRIDKLLEENESLILELQARAQRDVNEARVRSWGGNGRY